MILFDKILLVDDENICNFIASKMLEKANIAHSVESFLDAETALIQIKNGPQNIAEPKNLILLDINMPRMNGWEFLNEFEQLPEIILDQYIVMLLTSSIDHRDIEKSTTYKSVKKFISKPFSVDKITGQDIHT
jgi:CheY-like chemotaxis protein